MNLKDFQSYCDSLPGAFGDFPFDDKTLVYKVCGKMFTLSNFNDFKSISLKCDPEDALMYREIYEAVIPGYHLNKQHWNTINLDGSIPEETLKMWIKDSYDLVVEKLTKKQRHSLGNTSAEN
ncbi:MAG: MmcQ/YjbR family DNA-binding protein [Spirochaetales bacterium]|nr:MmcQ/YjbR family DNA-binding protein [Spirochaetales bacterium]